MYTKLLCLSATIISPSLACMFNISLATGITPDDWKLAKVTPIYKGASDLLDTSNYRPISIIGHLPTVPEFLVKAQVVAFFTDHNLFSSDQSAYLKYHSTQTCLHKIIDEWREIIDDGNIIGACIWT